MAEKQPVQVVFRCFTTSEAALLRRGETQYCAAYWIHSIKRTVFLSMQFTAGDQESIRSLSMT